MLYHIYVIGINYSIMKEIISYGETKRIIMVDDNMFDELNKYKWYIGAYDSPIRYKMICGKRRTYSMTREILKINDSPLLATFKKSNFNYIDCRASNLETKSMAELKRGKSPSGKTTPIGVTKINRTKNKYLSTLVLPDGSHKNIGTFSSKTIAHKEYIKQKNKYFKK